MPTQIPTLQRTAPVAPSSAGRITAPVPDFTGAQKTITHATNSVLNAVEQYQEKVENELGVTERNKAVKEYSDWYNLQVNGDSKGDQELLGLRFRRGDPTEHYNNFDAEAKKKLAGIRGGVSSFSKSVQNKINLGLDNAHRSLFNNRLAIYGSQYARYDSQITADAIELEKREAVTATIHIKPGDLSSLEPFDNSLYNIQKIQIEHALKDGTAVETKELASEKNGGFLLINDEGQKVNIKLSATAQNDILKHTSDAVYNSIKNLLASNEVDKAKLMMDNYLKRVEPLKRAKLVDAFEEAMIEVKAFEQIGKMGISSFEEKRKILRNIKNEKIRQKTAQLLDAREKYKANRQRRHQEEVYQTAHEYILANVQNKDRRTLFTQADIESDSFLKSQMGELTKKSDRKALFGLVNDDGSSSNEKRAIEALGLRGSPNDLFNLTETEVYRFKADLSKSDFNRLQSQWQKIRTETTSQLRSKMTFQNREIRKQFRLQGLLPVRDGKTREADEKRLIEVQTKVGETSDRWEVNTSLSDMISHAVKIGNAEKVERTRKSESKGFIDKILSFWSGDKKKNTPLKLDIDFAPTRKAGDPGPEQPAPDFSFKDLSPEARDSVEENFRTDHNGRDAKNFTELKDWFENKMREQDGK